MKDSGSLVDDRGEAESCSGRCAAILAAVVFSYLVIGSIALFLREGQYEELLTTLPVNILVAWLAISLWLVAFGRRWLLLLPVRIAERVWGLRKPGQNRGE